MGATRKAGWPGGPDAALVAAAQQGDRRALEELVAACLPLVYNVVGRALRGDADTDDVVQETLLRMVGGLHQLRDPETFRSWLVAIAVRQVHSIRRERTAARERADLDAVAQLPDPAADFAGLTILRLGLTDQRREVAEATRWLDEDDHDVLALWWLEETGELSRAEVADALRLSTAHTAVRVQRLKERIETARTVVRALAALRPTETEATAGTWPYAGPVPRGAGVRRRCDGLAGLAERWDGTASPLWRKRFARHIRACPACSRHAEGTLPIQRLLGGLPLLPAPLALGAALLPGGDGGAVQAGEHVVPQNGPVGEHASGAVHGDGVPHSGDAASSGPPSPTDGASSPEAAAHFGPDAANSGGTPADSSSVASDPTNGHLLHPHAEVVRRTAPRPPWRSGTPGAHAGRPGGVRAGLRRGLGRPAATWSGVAAVTAGALVAGYLVFGGGPEEPQQARPAPVAAPSSSSARPSPSPSSSATHHAKPKPKPSATATPSPSRETAQRAAPAASARKGVGAWPFGGADGALRSSGAQWYYTWSPQPDRVSGPGFVPMVWGEKDTSTASLAQAEKRGPYLLGFNEPDMPEQANLSPQRALELWPKLMAHGKVLGSPAVAHSGDQPGGWLDEFMSGAKSRGYRVDFIALHWYGGDFVTDRAVEQLRSYLKAVHDRYGKPIWLTEYALIDFADGTRFPDDAQQAAFVRESTRMLETLPYVQRYAWFGLGAEEGKPSSGLYRPGGAATAAGRAFASAG